MINKAVLLGTVTKKLDKISRDGHPFVTLTIVTSKKYYDAKGIKRESTNWHNVNFFSKFAEVVSNKVDVGDLIYVEGEINHQKIERHERETVWCYSVHAVEMKIVSKLLKTY